MEPEMSKISDSNDTSRILPGSPNESSINDASRENDCNIESTTDLTENPIDKTQTNPTQIATILQSKEPVQQPPTNNSQTNQTKSVLDEQQLVKAKRELESMVLKYAKSERENLQNQRRADELEKKLQRSIKDNEQLASRIRILTNDKNQLNDTLSAKVAQLTVLDQKKSQIDIVQCVRLKEVEQKLVELEATNEDLLKKIEALKTKEGETLDFCEVLSMKLVLLQSELDEAHRRVPKYKIDYEKSIEDIAILNDKLSLMTQEIDSLRINSKEGEEKLKKVLDLKDESEISFKKRIDELENDMKVMRRKHQIASRELAKEVKLYKESTHFKESIHDKSYG